MWTNSVRKIAGFLSPCRHKTDRTAAADEIDADLDRIYSWGQKWNINFQPARCQSLCVSLKRDVDLHPPLSMATLSIDEVDVLKNLGIYFDRKLTWSYND